MMNPATVFSPYPPFFPIQRFPATDFETAQALLSASFRVHVDRDGTGERFRWVDLEGRDIRDVAYALIQPSGQVFVLLYGCGTIFSREEAAQLVGLRMGR